MIKKRYNRSIILELWDFLKVRKTWWLLPIIILLFIIGLIIVVSQSSAISPFIYVLF